MLAETIQFEITRSKTSKLDSLRAEDLQFGKVFTDHMLIADFIDGEWQTPKILPYQNIELSPATSFIHYGQSIFEGLKAHTGDDGEIYLFRPEKNFERFNASAARMCMPNVPEEIFMEGIKQILKIDKEWIPKNDGSAMYIRPFMFGIDNFIGVKASNNYRFMVILSPSGQYYKNPVKVKVEQEYSRAGDGGTGAAKCSGNYAGSLYPAKLANSEGYDQLIWTDAKTHSNVEESGTMNIMFVIDDTLVTPALTKTILPGITRDAILTIARDWDMNVEERTISVEEVIEAQKKGKLKEAFGVGTAATIAPIKCIGYNGKDYDLPSMETRKFSNKMSKHLEDLKRNRVEDKFGYLTKL